MRNQATEKRLIGDHACEFVPPLDLSESWGVKWDRQISAAVAWQEARAELEEKEKYVWGRTHGSTRYSGGEAGVGYAESGSSAVEAAHGERAPTMRTVARITTLLSSLRERLLQLQSEVANVAIAEMGHRQAGNSVSDSAKSALPPLRAENITRVSQLTRSWFEIVAHAQGEMRTMTGLTASPPSGVERRSHAAVINFPDRRAA